MSADYDSAAANAKAPSKGKIKHLDELPADLARFYTALGRFNTDIVSIALHEPEKVRELIKDLNAFCPAHDTSCEPGYVYDHVRNVCVRIQDNLN
jgi:hypothetical protein